jgi:hypothetical protein
MIAAADDNILTITSNLPQRLGYYYTISSMLYLENITGTCDPARVQSITINWQPAQLVSISGTWRIGDNDSLNLYPGINRIIIQSFSGPNGTGSELAGGNIEIWYDRGPYNEIGGSVSGTLFLNAENGPWHVVQDITVDASSTLEIEAGATLFFMNGSRLIIQEEGCLKAEGAYYEQIYLTKNPEQPTRWRGIRFEQSQQDNRLIFVVMTFGDSSSQMISVDQSRLIIDSMTWDAATDKTVLALNHPSITIRHCVFPTSTGVECVHGSDLSSNEYLVLDGNIFHPTTGYNDIIDFSNCKRPGSIIELYNNTFLGGSDDGLDLDGCDAHIEGNIFQNFHKDHDGSSTSNAIATGEYNGHTSDIVVVRNIFRDNDHAVLLKENCYMEAVNNIFADASEAAINFDEPDRGVTSGRGVYLDGNIFFQNREIFANRFAPEGEEDPEIIVNRSIIDSAFHSLGINNLDANPQFIDPENGNFQLQPNSPARETGPNGLDMGALVPAGASISGEPPAITANTNAMLTINGPGIKDYRYAVNDTTGGWSAAYAVTAQPQILLQNLIDGQTYTVYVQGKNSAGRWQWSPAYATSNSWMVDITNDFIEPNPHQPIRFTLSGYPNPFNPVITIIYTLPAISDVNLAVYDLSGQKVKSLIHGFQTAGSHSILWDGTDNQRIPIASGVYIVNLASGRHQMSRKITLIR